MVMVGSSSLSRFAAQLLTIHLLSAVLLCCGGSSSSSNNATHCPEHERQALFGLIPTGGKGEANNLFLAESWIWGPTNCCQWYGIACDRRTGHIVRIDLRGNPYVDGGSYELKLDNSLLALSKHLRYLDLSGNGIYADTPDDIPVFIGSFHNLRYLNLSYTDYTGDLVLKLGNLSRLQTLSVMPYDFIVEHLRIDDPRWLSRLTSLQQIELAGVSSGFGWVQALSKLPSIRLIRLRIWAYQGAMRGLIPSYLNPLNFTNLSVLDLSGFETTTTVLPSWLSNLTRLQYLRLNDCNLRGDVEAVFWNLSSSPSLEVLDLSGNQLHGSIPEDTFLGRMSMLRELDLYRNNLSGSVPRSLGRLSRLEILILYQNNFSGTIPQSLGRLSRLESLVLSENNLSGTIPQCLGRLSRLEFLDLSNNNLSGSVPQSLGRLSRLEFLDLSNNSLTGSLTEAHFANLSSLKRLHMSGMNSPIALDVGSSWQPPFRLQDLYGSGCRIAGGRFPRWLRSQLQSLSTLDISNTGIQDSIPRWFWIDNSSIFNLNFSCNAIFGDLPTTLHSPRLKYIDLSSNNLHGPLPQLFNAPDLLYLGLSNNSFSGPISNIGTPNLGYLMLSKNKLTGEVPAFICQTGLTILDLSQNHLTGELPDCHQPVFFQAIICDLSDNKLSGRIPDNLGSGDCLLYSLYLNNNNFSGELPSSLTKCRSLRVLDLAYNEFTGNIAIWLGDSHDSISNLSTLSLRSNKFYGSLPTMLSEAVNLKILDLSFNNLSGAIPPSFGSFQSMMTLDASDASDSFFTWGYFEDRVLLWMKGKEYSYDKLLKFLVDIDLAHNDLSGTIPEQLANLILLQSLNLSNNHLTGEITTKIGRMQQLESLDLSYNRLSGSIPTGGQLGSFQDPSAYKGNPFLNTTTEGAFVGENKDEDIDEKFWLYIGIAPGYVVGIWVVFGTLLFKKTWRYAYFRAMDAMHDKILCRQS